MLIIQKFGGSSLADLEALRRSAGLALRAAQAGHELAVVVSARGKSTDELLALAHEISPDPPPRELDALLTTGEQQSAALFAIMLASLGQKARSFAGWQAGLHANGPYGDGRVAWVLPSRLREPLHRGAVAVVTGFQALNDAGDLITLGRGGSDTSAVALASALDAARCEIYTDVDGIYTADPRLVPEARLLPEIDFDDMLRLARAGSQVLHDRCVELGRIGGVEIRLLSSFTADGGTVVRRLPEERRPAFAGLTRDLVAGTLTLVGRGAGPEALARLELGLSERGFPVLGSALPEGAAALRLPPERLEDALRAAHGIFFS